ncbi:uncharacterized protein [Neodiprion pinetum]|uniref:uncharacterized protein LOC124176340 isoform X1 n=1 Tax=Neodiprion fabricii TaxID=2872261 RepID=UPI001ED9360E|nr:uncharacterized protein LOC124176340 isoform X1 [Neodiprion fabricii]XP_046469220.1 uncharacterized protein LOC124212800 isoform X1 [Neodiprion pinetum]
MWRRILMSIAFTANLCLAQDYEVSEIQCSLAGSGSDLLTAKIRRPVGFKGAPLFADDRAANPLTDPSCQIRPDPTDPQEDNYLLKVTDFSRCGILKRNEFIHLRVWFPAFPGVVMLADQELILMCRPPEPTLLRHKAAGFAGTFPHGARVSGVVEETPGRLEYEVALYREAVGNASDPNAASQTVDQAVPIGTKLQLRARISSESAWGHIKLLEVTVSPDPDEPHAPGSVALVKDGCRNRDFASIIPHQPARYRGKKNEVFLDFEAFLLSSMRERSTLWIHSQIKACMEAQDCQPSSQEFCLDLFEPAGHGKRRRRSLEPDVQLPSAQKLVKKFNDSVPFTKFKENIEYTVLMPGDLYEKVAGLEGSCGSFFYLASGLGVLLVFSAFIMCYLASRLHSVTSGATHNKTIDDLVRERARKFSETQGYTGRSTVQ